MLPKRKLIGEFVGVFLIGALVGGLVVWDLNSSELTQFMSRTNNRDAMVARINKKYADTYHLSPDEMNRIQPLIKEFAQNVYQVRHQFGIDIIAVGDTYHQKIAEQMTPEHRAAYEQATAERRKKIANMLELDSATPGQN